MALKKPAKSNKSSSSTDRKSSLADLWDDTDSSEASNNLPEGEHEVRIDSMLIKDDKKKGTAVVVQYSAIEGEYEGKGLRQMYKLTDADGNKAPGLAYLMQSLELIGYKDIKGAKLKKTLEEITEEQPIVVIKAKENGQYMNAYLLGTPEDVAGKGKDDDDEDEDEDESEGEDSEIEVRSEVTFADPDDEDETLEGTVESINAKKGTAKVKAGKKSYVVDLGDLTLAEAEAEEEEEEEKPTKKGKAKPGPEEDEEDEDESDDDEEIAVKDEVTWTDEDDDEMTGIVSKISGSTAIVTDEDGDKHKVKLSDLTKVD